MNKQIIIAIIVILLLAGGAGFFLSKRATSPGTKTTPTTKDGGSTLSSLKDLLSMGKSQMCTYETTVDDTTKTSGTMYIANSKVRGDFTVTTKDNKTTTGSMINDGAYMYTWSSDMKQGMKIPMTEEMKAEADNAQQNPSQYVDPNVQIDYRCQGWMTDNSKFTPPTDITFTDYSAQMKELQKMQPGNEGAPDQKTQQCMACNYLQGEQQAQCKQSLGCP